MQMRDAYGPTLMDIERQVQDLQTARQGVAASRQSMVSNQQLMNRRPTEWAQADEKFKMEQDKAAAMRQYAELAKTDPKGAVEILKPWLSAEQNLIAYQKAEEKAAALATLASQKKAASGYADEFAPMPVAPSSGGVTSLGGIRAAGQQYDEGIAREQAVAEAYPDKYVESALNRREQEAKDTAALKRTQVLAVGKKGPRGLFDIANDVTELTKRSGELEGIINDLDSTPAEISEATVQLAGVQNAIAKANRDAEGVDPVAIKLARKADAFRRAAAMEKDPQRKSALTAAADAAEAASIKSSGEVVTYVDPTGKEQKFMLDLATGEMRDLGTKLPAAVTEAEVTSGQKAITEAETLKAGVNDVYTVYDPKFSTYQRRGQNWVQNMLDKADAGDEKAKEDVYKFEKFKRKGKQVAFTLRKNITGAAGSVQEFEQIFNAYISGDEGDAALRAALDTLLEKAARDIEINKGIATRKKDFSSAGSPLPAPPPPTPPPPSPTSVPTFKGWK